VKPFTQHAITLDRIAVGSRTDGTGPSYTLASRLELSDLAVFPLLTWTATGPRSDRVPRTRRAAIGAVVREGRRSMARTPTR